jgi:hypothetical protein
MNPITIAGGVAAAVALAYAGHTLYSAGKASVQSDWDKAKVAWQEERSALQTKVTSLERNLVVSQKEIQDAHESEKRKERELLALQRARADTAVAGLRNVTDQLSKRLAPKSDDSAALAECKAIASSYQALHGACVGRYRELGEVAQVELASARGRGLECERSYDAAERALRSFGVEGKPH